MPVLIRGIGHCRPPHRIAQAQAAELARQYSCETPDHERVFNAVYWGTASRRGTAWYCKRRMATRHAAIVLRLRQPPPRDRMQIGDEEEAGALAVSAARMLLAMHRIGSQMSRTCDRLMHRVLRAGFRYALDQATGLSAGIARTQWIHGLPWSTQWPAGWLRRLSPPIRRPASCLRGRDVQPSPPIWLECRKSRRQLALWPMAPARRRDGRQAPPTVFIKLSAAARP